MCVCVCVWVWVCVSLSLTRPLSIIFPPGTQSKTHLSQCLPLTGAHAFHYQHTPPFPPSDTLSLPQGEDKEERTTTPRNTLLRRLTLSYFPFTSLQVVHFPGSLRHSGHHSCILFVSLILMTQEPRKSD